MLFLFDLSGGVGDEVVGDEGVFGGEGLLGGEVGLLFDDFLQFVEFYASCGVAVDGLFSEFELSEDSFHGLNLD